YFRGHPLGFRVLGTTDTIKALTCEQMREYFRGRYSPDNIIVAAAGRLDFTALVKDLEKLCGHWSPTGAMRLYDEPPAIAIEESLNDAKLSRHYLGLLCPAPSAQDDAR